MNRGRHEQGPQRQERSTRRLGRSVRVALFVVGALAAAAIPAAAFMSVGVTTTGSYSEAMADSLGSGNAPTSGGVTGENVTITWTASTIVHDGQAATGYTIARYNVSTGGTATPATSGCAGTVTALTCTEQNVPPGNWWYTVTPQYHAWTGAESGRLAVTVGSPTFSITSGQTVVAASGGTISTGILANFADNETLTFHLDSATGTVLATTPSTVTTNGSGSASVTSFTIPAGISAGSHTIVAVGGTSGLTATSNSFTASQAPSITSANSATFITGTAGSFTVTTTGTPTPSLTNANFAGCTKSSLPTGVTFQDNGNGTAAIASTTASPVGTTTLCLNASNGVGSTATQTFTLTIDTGKLVITSTAVSGATSSTPNLGAITVQRQNGSGTPITTGGALTVNLSSSPSSGATFGTSQFGSTVTSVTIASGASTATFWYGLTSTGTPAITASATNYVSGTQQQTVTTAPAGLGMVAASGSPTISCGTPALSYTCNVSGVGSGGSVTFYVTFWDTSKNPVVYSATQASGITESGQSSGNVTIAANASSSSPSTLTASHTGSSTKTSTLTFGPYTLTINVSS